MLRISRRTLAADIAGMSVFTLAGLLHYLPAVYPGSDVPLAGLRELLYIGILLCWMVSVSRRILQRNIRRCLVLSALLMVFWMLARTNKYIFITQSEAADRMIWYLYYLPMLTLPLLSLLAARCIGLREDEALPRRWYLLFIPCSLLLTGILTNDLHQLAFRFQADFRLWNSTYVRGPIYYIAALWILLLAAGTLFVVFRKCSLSSSRKLFWVPLLFFCTGLTYFLVFFTAPRTPFAHPYQLPEMFCFILVTMWESYIQIGLIPSNTGYEDFFNASTLRAQITDRDCRPFYRAGNADRLTRTQLQAAAEAPVMLDADTRLHSQPIRAGCVFWEDDLSAVNRLNGELAEVKEGLTGENALMQAEYELQRQRIRIAEHTRLYDGISRLVRPQLDKIDGLLRELTPDSPDFAAKMARACVLKAYIKRRSNLVLLAENTQTMEAAELGWCMRESMDSLSLCGTVCSLTWEETPPIPVSAVMLAYDFFEAVVEASLPSLPALLVRLTPDLGGVCLRMVCGGGLPPRDWQTDRLEAEGASLRLDWEGSDACARLLLPTGGGT